MSLKPVVEPLELLLGAPGPVRRRLRGRRGREAVVADLDAGGVVLLENVRFHAGEEKNDPAFAAQLAELGDLYVNDAFSAAHRAHASTEGLARLLPAYAGEPCAASWRRWTRRWAIRSKPVMGIVGGAKVSTKLDLLKNLVGKLDRLAIGGGMANTFLFAQGVDIGGSLCEKDLADTAREIIERSPAAGLRTAAARRRRGRQEVKPGVRAGVRALDRSPPTSGSWTPVPRPSPA